MLNLKAFLNLAAIIPPLPYNIVDGQLIDAVPVMGNFNAIVAAVNANVPALIGANTYVPSSSVGGTGNAITLAPSPLITAYAEGQTFTFLAINFNTGPTTVAVSGLAVRPIKNAFGAQLSGQEIVAGGIYTITDTGVFYELTNGAQGSGPILFTPVITFGGASVGQTYSAQKGVGFKVNNIFYFAFNTLLTAKGSSTGDVAVDGLPYAVNATFDNLIFPVLSDTVTIAGKNLIGSPIGTSTHVAIAMNNSGGVFTIITDAECTNASGFDVTGWYPVA